MGTTTVDRLKADLIGTLKFGRTISAKAESEGRGFTALERETIDKIMAKAEAIKEQIQAKQGDADLIQATRDFGKAVDLGVSGGSGAKAETWAKKVSDEGGYKAVTTGVILNEALDTNIVSSPSKARFVQDLVQKKRPEGRSTFAYLRQNVRDNQAAFVAPGTKKPESRYQVERVEGALGIVAHTSEPQHRYDLLDADFLGDFLKAEMYYGLQLEIESHIVETLLADAGVTTIPWSNGLLETLRKAKTKLAKDHVEPTALIVNPDEAERLDLITDINGRYYFAGPSEADASQAWSIPIIQSTAVASGVGIVGDLTQACRLYMDEQVLMDTTDSGIMRADDPATTGVDEYEDLFTTDMVRLRAETRVKAAILRPFAAVEVDLTQL